MKVPGGLAFSEFRGYEAWQAISISRNEKVVAVILGNPAMIDAYRAGIPGNGKPVPDGAKMAKIHWTPKQNEFFPDATVPGKLAERGLHGEGQQEVRGQRRMGICRVRLRRRVRYVQARHHSWHAAAGKRRQVRVRVPHDERRRETTFSLITGTGEARCQRTSAGGGLQITLHNIPLELWRRARAPDPGGVDDAARKWPGA